MDEERGESTVQEKIFRGRDTSMGLTERNSEFYVENGRYVCTFVMT